MINHDMPLVALLKQYPQGVAESVLVVARGPEVVAELRRLAERGEVMESPAGRWRVP